MTKKPQRLTITRILTWADLHRRRTGKWPNENSGAVRDARGEDWNNVNSALRLGLRGLARGSSLAQLLGKRRGARTRLNLPRLSVARILSWADAHHRRREEWPGVRSGPVWDAPAENWFAIHTALINGYRGLPGGDTLAKLLIARRGAQKKAYAPKLTAKQILSWADDFHRRTGRWPRMDSGRAYEPDGPQWMTLHHALMTGRRGLPGGTTLPKLLAKHRGVRNPKGLPRLTYQQILKWSDDHYRRTGRWPSRSTGRVLCVANESWGAITYAMVLGQRGLRKGFPLHKFLAKHRGVRNAQNMPRLTLERILQWAGDHHRRTGKWPRRSSDAIFKAPGETWIGIDRALRNGTRSLPRGFTLRRLLVKTGLVR